MNYKERVLPILRNTRAVLLPAWGSTEILDQKTDSMVDIVTKLDLEVEAMTAAALAEAYPDIAFVGEESGGDRSASRFWLMDPIDGTQHFVRGLPFCTVMLALIEDGQVTFSAIYDFVNDDMYWAERGNGAYRNDVRISVSNRSLKDSYVCFETHLSVSKNMDLFNALREQTFFFKSIVSGWEYIMVASGKLDARITLDPYGRDYDFAPGSLLVHEAGGIVANIGANTYTYKNLNFIAANPAIYKELTQGEAPLFPLD